MPIVKDAFLAEVVVRDVRNRFFFELIFLAPTKSGNDAGARFCAPLPLSPPRLGGINAVIVHCSRRKTLHESSDFSQENEKDKFLYIVTQMRLKLWMTSSLMWLIFSPKNVGTPKTGSILWNYFHSKCDILYTYIFISMFSDKIGQVHIYFRFCPASINTPRHLADINTTRRLDRF
jgi:hypothetical protein